MLLLPTATATNDRIVARNGIITGWDNWKSIVSSHWLWAPLEQTNNSQVHHQTSWTQISTPRLFILLRLYHGLSFFLLSLPLFRPLDHLEILWLWEQPQHSTIVFVSINWLLSSLAQLIKRKCAELAAAVAAERPACIDLTCLGKADIASIRAWLCEYCLSCCLIKLYCSQ